MRGLELGLGLGGGGKGRNGNVWAGLLLKDRGKGTGRMQVTVDCLDCWFLIAEREEIDTLSASSCPI